MFGFAVDETPELMPAPISYAHKLAKKLTDVRKKGLLPYLRPDGKTQVTVEYDDATSKPLRIDAVVISSQHSEDVKHKTLKEQVIEEVVKAVVPERLIDKKTKFHINPTGRFVLGGPYADTGLTGRKIIVDSYGGMGRTRRARSAARPRPRSTAAPANTPATWRRTSSLPSSRAAARCRLPMTIWPWPSLWAVSVSPTLPAPVWSKTRRSPRRSRAVRLPTPALIDDSAAASDLPPQLPTATSAAARSLQLEATTVRPSWPTRCPKTQSSRGCARRSHG